MSAINDRSIDRAISAGKAALAGKAILTNIEQAHLEQFSEKDRLAVLVFVRWAEGRKFKDGIAAKMAAKTSFIEAFRIARAIYDNK